MVLLPSVPPRRRALLLLVAAVALTAVCAGLFAAVRSGRAAGPVDQGTPGPVVLVPGYGGGTASLSTLERRLRADGRQVHVLVLPEEGTGDLRGAARALDQLVGDLEDAGAPSVDVVGYSAGGVTARLWARLHDGASRARRIVTLGSPHHGTDVAAAVGEATGGCDVACTQLQPGSSLLAQLNRGDETPDGPVWVSVWTDADETVVPPSSGRLRGGVDVRLQDLCPGSRAGHGDLPRNPAVMGLVTAALTGPSVPAPARGDCERYAPG